MAWKRPTTVGWLFPVRLAVPAGLIYQMPLSLLPAAALAFCSNLYSVVPRRELHCLGTVGCFATIKIKCIRAHLGENMGPFSTVAVVLQIAFWCFLLAVAAMFVTSLIRGTIEDIIDHRRIAAARIAQGFSPPTRQWERMIRIQLRNH